MVIFIINIIILHPYTDTIFIYFYVPLVYNFADWQFHGFLSARAGEAPGCSNRAVPRNRGGHVRSRLSDDRHVTRYAVPERVFKRDTTVTKLLCRNYGHAIWIKLQECI